MFRLRVDEALKEKGVSYNALSLGAGISRNMVRRLVKEGSTYDPASSTLFKVARYLNVNMSDLCYDDDVPPPASRRKDVAEPSA